MRAHHYHEYIEYYVTCLLHFPATNCVKLQEVFLSFPSQVFAEYLILRKFYDRHHDMVNCYGKSVSQMTTDMFHKS